MGYADTIRNAIDGRTYTVSTVKKFETWECAVFEGRNAFLMGLGRGMRYIEYVFPWDGAPVAIHRQIVQMAAADDPNGWQMSKQEIGEARTVATAFVTNEMRKFLSLIAKDGWRVRKGRVRQPRGFSKPLFIPDQVADTTSPRAADDPVRRYAKNLLELAEEGATSIVPDASGVTFGLVSEFCYFLIQWAQRTAVERLTDAQMRDVIPRLCYSVFDALVDRAGLDLRKPEDFEAGRAEWINDGADRNDLYRRCRAVAPKEGEGASGTLLWEASRVIAKAAHQEHPATEVTVAMLLPALGSRLDVNDLVAASRATRQIAADSTPLENNPPALRNRTPAQVGTGTSTVKPEALPPRIENPKSRSFKAGAIRVLIVDDIASTRDNLSKLLSFESDIQVVGTAPDGSEAIEQARSFTPDIVVMGINMPVMDGITATQRLSKELPQTRVIAMSVQGAPDCVQRAFQAGAFDFLCKPFSGDDLVNSIRFVWEIAKGDELMTFRAAMAKANESTHAKPAVSVLDARLTAWRTLVQMRYASAWARETWTEPQLLERARATGVGDLINSVRSAKEAGLRAKAATEAASKAWEINRQVVDRLVDPSTIYEQYEIAVAAHEKAKSAALQGREATAILKARVSPADMQRAIPKDPASSTAGRILILEDSPVQLRLARHVLEKYGFEVRTATSSAECLTELAEGLPDLLMTDIQHPGEDGLALARRLRNDSRTADLTIVACTVHGMPGDREKILAAGFDGYIQKPIDPALFATQITGYLRQRKIKEADAAAKAGGESSDLSGKAAVHNEMSPRPDAELLAEGARSEGGRISPCPDCSGSSAIDLQPRQVKYWLRLTRNKTSDSYDLACYNCGSTEPLPPSMLAWAVRAAANLNKALGPEVIH